MLNNIYFVILMDSFKNFVDFLNPFCGCHSKLDLCDRFVLKHLVWSWIFFFLILALFFGKHFLFCCLFFQFVYLLGDKWSFYILGKLIFLLFHKLRDEIHFYEKLKIVILFQLHHNLLNQINFWLFSVVGGILRILPQKDEIIFKNF